MKVKIPFLLAAGLLPFAAAAAGSDSTNHLYLSTDVGAAFEQGLRIRGADLIDFHNGVRGDVALGYHVTSWFAAELSGGVIWTTGDKIGGVTLSSFSAGMDLYQIPIMGNAIFSYPIGHGFRPYAGAGFGGVAGVLVFERPLGRINDTDFTFSYQAMAGMNYEASPRVVLGLGYKYLATGDHSWAQNGVTLKTEGSGTHSVTASFTWKF